MEKTNFNVAPYFDDFNESKNFHRILFRPGYAVQGRELTQLQTILQNQIDRFGSHIFAAGSPVKGGETNLITDINYLKLEATNAGVTIRVSDFLNQDIVKSGTSSCRARVMAVAAAEGSDPPTLMIQYLGGEEFVAGDSIAFAAVNGTTVAKIQSSSATGKGTISTIQDGIFFVRGFFVQILKSTVILNKYSNIATDINWDVGLQITESIVDDSMDSSLLDPALDASNYQAPGAHRLAINLTWDKRTVDSVDKDEFIVLLKIRNGVIVEQVQHPIYSEIEKTMARRTYDESGNYTVKAFRAAVTEDTANANNYIIRLEAGKAYVFGHEFETIAPTYIYTAKPRNTEQITGFSQTVNYGNYAYVNNANGLFDATKFDLVDLHVVSSGYIDFSTNGSMGYTNTKIGTARVRDFATIGSYATVTQANTYQYRAHLFDVNTTYLSANATAGTANTIGIAVGPNTDVQINSTDILGAQIRIVAGTASGGGSRTITAIARSSGNTKTITVDRPWTYTNTAPDTTSTFIIDWAFADVRSIAKQTSANTGIKSAAADISLSSKDVTSPYLDAYLTDTNFDSLIVPVGHSFIKDGITNASYTYRKLTTTTINGSLQASIVLSGETFVGTASASQTVAEKVANWFIVANATGGTYNNGDVVPVGNTECTISLSADLLTATVTLNKGVNGQSFSFYSLVKVAAGATGRKTKTAVTANTTYVATTPTNGSLLAYDINGSAVSGVNIYPSFGQIDFSDANTIVRSSNSPQVLYIPDVYQLVKVVQTGNTNMAANVTSAMLSDTTKDITSSYTLFTGQTDGYYDQSYIKLNPGAAAPVGQIRVFVNYYEHSSGGYFSLDSYPNVTVQSGYAAIPQFTGSDGTVYSLRDVIDFRPRKPIGYANTFGASGNTAMIAASLTAFNMDFRYYLARIDHLVLTRDLRFEVVKGIDSLRPGHPSPRNDAMLLNIVYLPPYVTNANSVVTMTTVENKRYTMRDIGGLEKRIESLEYYTSLSLLEQATLNKKDLTLQDDAGLERTKLGILVDTFSDFSASDVSADYQASLDTLSLKMRPSINTENFELFFSSNGSSNGSYALTGPLLTLPYTMTEAMQYNPYATHYINVNPFNVTKWGGTIGLSPPSDTWISTKTSPPVITSNNAFSGQPLVVTQLLWNTQQTLFHGTLGAMDTPENRASMIQNALSSIGVNPDVWTTSHLSGVNDPNNIFPVTYEFTVDARSTGTRTIRYEDIRTTTGVRLINATIIPFCRAKAVTYRGKNLRPNTAYYAFFDGTDVTNYVRRANIITFGGNDVTTGLFSEEVMDTYGNPDLINIRTAANTFLGYKTLISYANGIGVLTPVDTMQNRPDWQKTAGALYPNAMPTYINTTSGPDWFALVQHNSDYITYGAAYNKKVTSYEHYSGNVTAATASTINLNNEAHANASFFSPSIGKVSWATLAGYSSAQWAALGEDGKVRIVSGTGAGQSKVISSYALATNQLTIVGTWDTTPDTTSIYSIGLPRSVPTGHCGGVFYLPNTSSMQFRTGTRIFKLTDSSTNDDTAAQSIGQARYDASGREEEYREDILVTRQVVSDITTRQDTIWATQSGWNIADPLAQSFIVDAIAYPYGVHLGKIRTCFATKDSYLPIVCEIRPMVNGYPDAKKKIAQTILDPAYVKVADTIPSISDSTKYTEFVFPAPVYLAPGAEYAVVFLSDSNQYNIWSAEFGTNAPNKSDVNSGATISRQPLLGSLFKSQNGSTWTAVQEDDLMFGAYVCKFDRSKTANVNFKLYPTTANANVDLFMATISDIKPPGTTASYQYTSELASGGLTAPLSFKVLDNTEFTDNKGRRVFANGSNATFQVYGIMTSNNAFVSPAIDISAGLSVFGVEYRINNGELSNNNLYITNGGTGYAPLDNANITVTITGGNGSGATAKVSGINNGVVTGIEIVSPGSGYTSTPNIALTFGGSGNATMRAANTNASAIIVGETSTSGGNMKARYITKTVTLADGFDSSDLRVFLTGYRPVGSNIYVYYKVMSAEDNDFWENKTWNLMSQLGNTNTYSGSKKDYFEMTFAPGAAGVAANEITYSGFNTFKTFQIKVCFTATNPTDVPEFDSIRIIALPSGKVL